MNKIRTLIFLLCLFFFDFMYSYTPRLYISLINIYAIKIEYTFKIERERERKGIYIKSMLKI